jgi:opacity protein-like surface antigen
MHKHASAGGGYNGKEPHMRLAIVALLALTLAAAAQEPVLMIDQGTKEVGINGGLNFDTENGTLVDLTGTFGYFVRDLIEVGAIGRVTDDDSVTFWGAGVFVEGDYDLGTDWFPYAAISAEFNSTDFETADGKAESSEAFALGFWGGLKYFFITNAALDIRLTYRRATDNIYAKDDKLEKDDWQAGVGLRVFFQ